MLDSQAFRNLSANARALLLEVARQFRSDDNGRMLLSRAYLNGRGWMSSDMIIKGKRELLANGLIYQTVQGQRPHKASWYAVTWYSLDKLPGLDPDLVHGFRQGAYRDFESRTRPLSSRVTAAPGSKTKPKSAVPPHGTEKAEIGPPHGTEAPPAVPPHGPIRGEKGRSPVPPHGHPLDMPSPAGLVRPLPPLELKGSPVEVVGLVEGLLRRNAARTS